MLLFTFRVQKRDMIVLWKTSCALRLRHLLVDVIDRVIHVSIPGPIRSIPFTARQAKTVQNLQSKREPVWPSGKVW